MKKILNILLFFGCIVIINSCKKEVTEDNTMDFKFIGVIDTIVGLGETFSRTMKVYYLGGNIEEVTFTNSGVPNGVEISYSPSPIKPEIDFEQIIKVSSIADSGSYPITVIGTATGGKTYQKDFVLYVPAKVKYRPRITLLGNPSMNLVLNTSYVEPGYTANDAEDGVLTSQVQVTNPVNFNLVGNYNISYKVTDSDGLFDSIVRKVVVKNNLSILNNTYNCKTTDLQSGVVKNWISAISASDTLNNNFVIFKISDCFLANPVATYNPSKDSIFMSAQTFLCITPVDTLNHTFEGKGRMFISGTSVYIILIYTDTYVDPFSGNIIILNKKDEYSI